MYSAIAGYLWLGFLAEKNIIFLLDFPVRWYYIEQVIAQINIKKLSFYAFLWVFHGFRS